MSQTEIPAKPLTSRTACTHRHGAADCRYARIRYVGKSQSCMVTSERRHRGGMTTCLVLAEGAAHGAKRAAPSAEEHEAKDAKQPDLRQINACRGESESNDFLFMRG